MVGRTLVSQNSVPRPKFHHGACVLVHRLSHPFGKMQIFLLLVNETARKAPIRNQHFNTVGTSSDSKITVRCSNSSPGFSRNNIFLDYANHWWSRNTESAYHDDRKLWSTRCENCSPGRKYGCTNIADIFTPSRLFSPL
ncbi:hypothetical protein Taro_015327 [Colocasia esculenta]|uniref:Uncharacterized protein n=1 Tax=Colocasia esculenta TaxID=4460 RepID=A0A843UM25_COLES|nr:hypothetical protein [Colocasia esculenta]